MIDCRSFFIGLGAQKAGTSWIFACLSDHPELHVPVKELHFFSKDDLFARGRKWYESHFAGAGEEQVTGEFSTTYLDHPTAIERIARHYPDARLIVSLRDPVERARSHFQNDKMAGLIDKNAVWDEALGQPGNRYVERGCYAAQIERVLRFYPADHLLVLIIEEAESDPAAFIAGIYRFLGVDDAFRSAFLDKRINVSYQPRSVGYAKAIDRTAEIFRRSGMPRLVEGLKKTGVQNLLRRLNGQGGRAPEVAVELPASARRALEEDRRRLEDLIDRRIEVWQELAIS